MNHAFIAQAVRGALLTLSLLGWAGASSAKGCVSALDTVNLAGELQRQQFPGPPNYNSIRHGDHPETVVILQLSTPLCVMLPDDVTLTPRPQHINELQLLSDEHLPKSSDKVRLINGTILLAKTGHHHLRVLLEVAQTALPVKSRRTLR